MDEVSAWQNRPLEPCYPVVFMDAIRVNIRSDGAVSNKAVFVALAILPDGTRDVLGLWFQANEGAKFWAKVLNDLRNRGVQDILIAVVDGLKGFPQAIEAAFPQTQVQTCIVHLLRHSMSFASYKDRKAVATALKAVYTAVDAEAAEAALAEFDDSDLAARYPAIAPSWRRAWNEVIPFLDYPPAVRRLIYTTDVIDKTFLLISANLFLCGRPRGEAWRVSRKRHRAAYSVPAGLRRPHTRVVSGDTFAKLQQSAHSFSLPVPRSALPDLATP